MSDKLLAKKTLATMIYSFDERKASVMSFLRQTKPQLSVEVVPLEDPFGPTVTDPLIEALVVSSETMSGVGKINAIRGQQGFAPLSALVVQRSNAATLSSTFIRECEATNQPPAIVAS
jgi:pantetheine-phosphate adenylyltransferase